MLLVEDKEKLEERLDFQELSCRMLSRSIGNIEPVIFTLKGVLCILFRHMTCIQFGQMWQTIHLNLLQNHPVAIYNSTDFILLVTLYYLYELVYSFPCGSAGKESACNAVDLGLIPGLGRSPGEGKGYPLQYSGLENLIDCIVYGVAKSWTRLRDFHFLYDWG